MLSPLSVDKNNFKRGRDDGDALEDRNARLPPPLRRQRAFDETADKNVAWDYDFLMDQIRQLEVERAGQSARE
jgi:hypothetical protein